MGEKFKKFKKQVNPIMGRAYDHSIEIIDELDNMGINTLDQLATHLKTDHLDKL